VTVRLLLVDDSPAIRRGLRSIIEEQTDWKVCGEAGNGKVALNLVQELHPDVILLDLSMPVMNGLDAARQIKMVAPQTYILLFTLHDCPQLVEDARKVGINRVLSKSGESGSAVVSIIRSLLAA
jgi:DNA-binding NarL/FixJ family response regulator